MQFQVPQFIETEAKIVGPLTLKQFFYLGGALGLTVFFFFTLKFFLFVILTVISSIVAFTFAFMKYNGQPMPKVITAAFLYFWNPRFYLWKSTEERIKPIAIPKVPSAHKEEGGLKNLLFKLTTTTTSIAKRERNFKLSSLIPNEAKERFEVLRKATGERAAARRVDYS